MSVRVPSVEDLSVQYQLTAEAVEQVRDMPDIERRFYAQNRANGASHQAARRYAQQDAYGPPCNGSVA